jgi:hypothetical protein
MATIEELEKLYKEARYRDIIVAESAESLSGRIEENAKKLLQVGWAYHQLGEYDKSIPIMEDLIIWHSTLTEIGESAYRGLAHGILQRDGDIARADMLMQNLPLSLGRDNVRINFVIIAVRKGKKIPVEEVMKMVVNAIGRTPYATVNGHIINNGALVLHEARNQEAVKPYLPILPGLIIVAIEIYRATNTAKNHLAGAYFRAAQIFATAGYRAQAIGFCDSSKVLWEELTLSEGGERYSDNLQRVIALKGVLEK